MLNRKTAALSFSSSFIVSVNCSQMRRRPQTVRDPRAHHGFLGESVGTRRSERELPRGGGSIYACTLSD
jgi:hypothetical protein